MALEAYDVLETARDWRSFWRGSRRFLQIALEIDLPRKFETIHQELGGLVVDVEVISADISALNAKLRESLDRPIATTESN